MASRDEFERAVYSLVSKARDHGRRLGCFYTLEGEDEDERAAAAEDAARADLLALWPEPMTCEGCLFNGAPMPLDGERCYICRRYPHVDNYQPKETS